MTAIKDAFQDELDDNATSQNRREKMRFDEIEENFDKTYCIQPTSGRSYFAGSCRAFPYTFADWCCKDLQLMRRYKESKEICCSSLQK